MRYEIKRIEVWSVVKIVFLLSLIAGFVIGLLYALMIGFLTGVMGTIAGGEFSDTLGMFGGVALIFVVIFFTIFFAAIYTIVAAIGTALYNLLAKFSGGFTLELKSTEKNETPVSQNPESVL